MAQYFSIYFASDDTEVTPIGDTTNAAEFELRFDLAEEDEEEVELYAEAEAGYEVSDAVISLVLTNTTDLTDRFALGDETKAYGNWGADLNLGSFGSGAASKTFWVKARTQPGDDTVERDDETGLEVEGVVSPE